MYQHQSFIFVHQADFSVDSVALFSIFRPGSGRREHIDLACHGGFHSHGMSRGIPNSWMVLEWKSQSKMDDEQGQPHFRKPPNA